MPDPTIKKSISNMDSSIDQLSLQMHAKYRGKVGTINKCPILGMNDLNYWYSPGVAAPCLAIYKEPNLVFDYTNKGNSVAIISDGSRILGLGNIGPKAGLPVIEGKALLFKYFGGVDAIPITLDEENPEKIIEIIIGIQPAFGAINLEDISTPKCYYILEELQKRLDIPVWHDDRQGTATVTLAGLINAIKLAGKNKNDIKIAFIGTGAAGLACANLLYKWGVDKENSIFVDINGILGKHRTEFPDDSIFREICETTNHDQIEGGIQEAMVGADVVIAFSKPGPDIIKPTWIKRMANKPIVFACANPIPEIWPWEAKKAGAFIVGTGRSDFDNQINNSLVFPGIFRGVLDVRAKKITDEMCFAAAQTLADFKNDQLSPDNILPKMTEMDIFPQQAAAVAQKAIEQGYSQLDLSKEQLYLIAKKRILENQNLMDLISQKIS